MEKTKIAEIIILGALLASTILGMYMIYENQTQLKQIGNFVVMNSNAVTFLDGCKVTQDNNSSVVLTCIKPNN